MRALPSIRILQSGPLLKVGATATALLCAGSAAFVGPVGSGPGSPAPMAPALDHYLCVPGNGGDCRSVAVTLPDGTTAAVGDPKARLDCDRVGWGHRSRHHRAGETIAVANALSPAGADGPTPVALVTGRLRWTCALTTPAPVTTRFGRRSPRFPPTTLARFACFGVEYPSRDAVRFSTPTRVRVGDHIRLDVRRPAVLCLPTGTGVADEASGASTNALVCFDTRVRRWWGAQLCVPSSTGGTPPPAGTPAPTTGSTTTTTTAPTTTSTSTTTSSSTTSTTTTTTSSTTTTTTTTTTRPTQPCAGVIVNGVCVINL